MYRLVFIALVLFNSYFALAQDKPTYKIYNSKGKSVKYKVVLKNVQKSNIILFGELHNNPIAHWLQYEISSDLHSKRKLILGSEMIASNNQQYLNQYLDSTITYEIVDSIVNLPKNFKTDYLPLVNFAKDNKIPFVATNIPRKYANLVYRNDFSILDTLPLSEKKWMAPLPIKFDASLSSYQAILEMAGDHGSPLMVKAQAIKDATMAYFILKNFNTNQLFIHINGSYHSDYKEGIVWYLKQANNSLNYLTISTVVQENINVLEKEHFGKADFIICVDSNMTTSY